MIIPRFRDKHPDFLPYPASLCEADGTIFFLARRGAEKYLVTAAEDFHIQPADSNALEHVRQRLPWLRPKTCGLTDSFGFGDRLGLATPGHIRVLGSKPGLERGGRHFFPILAQQSVRELERTGRTFESVLADAAWACFQEGYRKGFGAEADHVKEFTHLQQAVDAGYTAYVIDPSDRIRKPESMRDSEKRDVLEKCWSRYEAIYGGKTFRVSGENLTFSEQALRDIVLTYSGAVDFIEECRRFLGKRIPTLDFEVSVDETTLPTTPLAHIFIADQMRRRNIDFQNLALRFPGKFEKGIDYRGDLSEFRKALVLHKGVRDIFGPYKISLHSGSDKFSVYPVFREVLESGYHVKTSGTSWIEAVKAIAVLDRDFFVEILECGKANFERNSASYEISSRPGDIAVGEIREMPVEKVFENPAVRQVVHISYGSILSDRDSSGRFVYRDRFFRILRENEETYYGLVEEHIGRHLSLLE